MKAAHHWMLVAAIIAGLGGALPAYTQPHPALTFDTELQPWAGDLDGILKRRTLRVLVPYSKTLYFVDLGGTQRGMSYEFMAAFEAHLNLKNKLNALRVKVVMIPTARDELIPALLAGRGDIVAANLTITGERRREVDFTIPLARNVRELVVTGPGSPRLKTLDDLAGKEIFVRRASSYYESLLSLNKQFAARNLPSISLIEAPGHFETEDMLEMVNAGLVKIVIADDYIATLWKRILPRLTVHDSLAIRQGADIGFAVRKNTPRLLGELDIFSKTHRQGTEFGNVVLRKYLTQTRWVRNATAPADLNRFYTLVELFQKYGDKYRIDWLLMAAQGYQESQLDQACRSHAGAIGIMQIMPATGAQMRVGDITELEPNIHAGAKYVRHLIDEYFDDAALDDFNRMLFAFAAYNAGPSRLRTVRTQAKQRGLNPNVWFDNVERVAAQAIGRETVQYVSNIHKIYFAYSRVQENVQRDLERGKKR